MPAHKLSSAPLSAPVCLACPNCGGETVIQTSLAVCNSCDSNFPILDDVVDFRTGHDGHYDNPLKQADMQNINENLSMLPWRETLGRFLQLSGDIPFWLDKMVDEGRFAWKIYLGLRPGSKLLDYQCRLGASTQSLAPHFAKTYALEQTFENAVFTRKRMDKLNASDDVTVITCDQKHQIPLRDRCIDVVAADYSLELSCSDNSAEHGQNGFLMRLWERLRSQSGHRKLRRQQLGLLREMNRVLEHDGQLVIRWPNQLDLKKFIGPNDTSTQHKTSKLLDHCARLVSLSGSQRPRRHYLSTLWGYRKLLKQAGFSRIDVISIFEDDNLSEDMRPGPGIFALWSPPREESWKQRIKHNSYFAQDFCIIARKGNGDQQRLEEQIAHDVSSALDAEYSNFRTLHYFVSRKGKLIFQASCAGQDLFIRLPLTAHAESAESNNHSILKWLQKQKPALSSLFPRPILQGNAQKQWFFAETAVSGAPLVDLLKQQGNPKECLRIGLEFLVGLNQQSAEPAPLLNGSAYQRLVMSPLESMEWLITADQMNQLKAFFSQRLENKRIARGLMHGDYGARNILLQNARVSGLLDWEGADKDGLPAIDAICLVFSCYSRLGRGFKAGLSLVEMASRAEYFSEYLPALDEYYRITGVDPKCHEGLVLLYWVHVIDHRVKLGRTIRNTSSELMVQRIVREILNTMTI